MALLAHLRRLRTVAYFMTHPAVPLLLKALPIIALAYALFPRDLLLDLRPFGFVDDAVVAVLLLSFFTSRAAKSVARAGKAKQEAVPADFVVIDEDAPRSSRRPAADQPPNVDIRS